MSAFALSFKLAQKFFFLLVLLLLLLLLLLEFAHSAHVVQELNGLYVLMMVESSSCVCANLWISLVTTSTCYTSNGSLCIPLFSLRD